MPFLRKKHWALRALIIPVFLVIAVSMVFVVDPVYAKEKTKQVGNQLHKLVKVGSVYHSIGRLWLDLTNFGWMGDDTGATPALEWPGGSGNQYLYQGSIWVSGRDATGAIHCTAGDENEFFPQLSQTRIDAFTAANGTAFTSDDYVIVVASSKQTVNLDPDYSVWYDSDLYGQSGVDDDGDGLIDEDPLDFIDNDGDGLINEDFAAVSEEDTYTMYNDLWEEKHQAGDSPMGIEVIERTYAWSYSYAQDFIVFDYEVINVGTSSQGDFDDPLEIDPDESQTLSDVYLAIRYDMDISSLASGEFWYDDLTEYLESDKLSYAYDGDDPDVAGNDKGEGGLSPGYVGVRTLGTSKTDNLGREGIPCSHNWWTIDDDPSSDALKFQYMSNETFAAVPPSPYDYRFLHTVGPWDLAPGDTIRWIAATAVAEGLGGRDDPDPHNTPGSLRDVLSWAQEMYDAGWLAATPPPTPDVDITLQEDGSVLLDWSASAATVEGYTDPLSGEVDFEGYRVYKSERTDATGGRIWAPLASYDVPGDGVGGETGIQYSYTDSDVNKGFTYYYAVTSFDDGLTAIGELESSKGSGIRVDVAAPPGTGVEDVAVVPNPYRGSETWDHVPSFEEQWWAKVQFINLPEERCTIRIYTLTGDFVKEIVNDDGDSFENWDLISRHNADIVSGVYLFMAEDATGNTKVGKFVVIR